MSREARKEEEEVMTIIHFVFILFDKHKGYNMFMSSFTTMQTQFTNDLQLQVLLLHILQIVAIAVLLLAVWVSNTVNDG